MADSTYQELLEKIASKQEKTEAEATYEKKSNAQEKYQEIEGKLEEKLDIETYSDDQHLTAVKESASYDNQLIIDLLYEKRNSVMCIYIKITAEPRGPTSDSTKLPSNFIAPKTQISRTIQMHDSSITITISTNRDVNIEVVHGGSDKAINVSDVITYIA